MRITLAYTVKLRSRSSYAYGDAGELERERVTVSASDKARARHHHQMPRNSIAQKPIRTTGTVGRDQLSSQEGPGRPNSAEGQRTFGQIVNLIDVGLAVCVLQMLDHWRCGLGNVTEGVTDEMGRFTFPPRSASTAQALRAGMTRAAPAKP